MGKRMKKRIFIIMSTAIAAVMLIYLLGSVLPKTVKRVNAEISVKSEERVLEFLNSFGWQAELSSCEKTEQTLAEKNDDVFMKYNDLQKSQGFDLEEYAGKTVERYTFRLNNYPEVKSEVFANVLVFNGKIIGGDICTAALDGFMQGFDANARGECKATFLQK